MVGLKLHNIKHNGIATNFYHQVLEVMDLKNCTLYLSYKYRSRNLILENMFKLQDKNMRSL